MKKLMVIIIFLVMFGGVANAVPLHRIIDVYGLKAIKKVYDWKPNKIKRFVYRYKKFIC